MLDHTGIVVSDLTAARRFWDAVAEALGLRILQPAPEFFLLGRGPGQVPYLWIGTLRPSYWQEGSRVGVNQMHVAFAAASRAQVDAFHRAAIAAGGTDHGAPGPREGVEGYYGAFVLDPDGNNIEAAFREPAGVPDAPV